jgi:arylsulfatase A-like enzyme
LADLIPTLIEIMGYEKPADLKGTNSRQFHQVVAVSKMTADHAQFFMSESRYGSWYAPAALWMTLSV